MVSPLDNVPVFGPSLSLTIKPVTSPGALVSTVIGEAASLRAYLTNIVNRFRDKRMNAVRQFQRIEAPFAPGIGLGFSPSGWYRSGRHKCEP